MLKLNDAMTEEIAHRRSRTREIHTFGRAGSSFRTMRDRDPAGINVFQETF